MTGYGAGGGSGGSGGLVITSVTPPLQFSGGVLSIDCATSSASGVAEQATADEVFAGTTTGGSGCPLFVNPASMFSDSGGGISTMSIGSAAHNVNTIYVGAGSSVTGATGTTQVDYRGTPLTAASASAVRGVDLSFTAGDASAGGSASGVAGAGGSITINTGDAASNDLTSANGGDFTVTFGNGVGASSRDGRGIIGNVSAGTQTGNFSVAIGGDNNGLDPTMPTLVIERSTGAASGNVVDVVPFGGGSSLFNITFGGGFQARAASSITGSADAVQLAVKANATQTANIVEVQESDSTKVLTIEDAGGAAVLNVSNAIRVGNGIPTSNATCGIQLYGSGNVNVTSTGGLIWWSGPGISGSNDTGLARSAAGIVKTTNGSTGGGSLEVWGLRIQTVTTPWAAAAATAGDDTHIVGQDGGTAATIGVAGARVSVFGGNGSAGASGNNDGGAGGNVNLVAGAGGNGTGSGNGGAGGNAVLQGGAAGSTGNANGGTVIILPGAATGTGTPGYIRLQCLSSNNIAIDANGTLTAGTSAQRVLAFGSGVAPTTSPADATQLWVADSAAANANLFARNEAGFVSQLTGLDSVLASDYTNATATMSNTALSLNLLNGVTYSFVVELMLEDSTAADGVKIDFDGGTATASNFRANFVGIDGAAVLTTSQTTAIATDFAAATFTNPGRVTIIGTFTASASGTFILRAAQNAHTTGTLTIFAGSSMKFWRAT